MLHLHDRTGLLAAPSLPLDAELLGLLKARVAHFAKEGLLDMTEIVVIDADTTEADLVEAIGFTPLVDLDGRRFGQPGYCCPLEYVSKVSPGYYEAIVPVGNSGFAFIILVPDTEGIDPSLLAIMRKLVPAK